MDNDQKISNKSIFFIIIAIALVIITGSFAWLSFRTPNMAMVLTIGEADGMSITLKPYQIESSLSPVSTYQDGIVIDVTADNQDVEENDFKIYYKIDTIDDALKSQDFKYTVTKCTANCDNANNYSVLNNAGGNFANAEDNSNFIMYREVVPDDTTWHYKLYLWIDSSGGNQSNMQNKSISGEVRATIAETLFTKIGEEAVIDSAKSTYVSADTGIDFSAISSDTNGKGVYLRAGTEGDAYPVYYYRGNINNNNVLFAGYCWKIIRTTSTGGVKLLYNGAPSGTNSNQCTNTTGNGTQLASTSKFNTNSTSAGDVGYMYGATRYPYSYMTSSQVKTSYLYGNGFSYQNGEYTLVDTILSTGVFNNDYPSFSTHHYTCFNTTGTCDSIYYLHFSLVMVSSVDYITLINEKNISDAMNDMFANGESSTIKTTVDNWYHDNMINYTSKLEDTPWCNDRTIYQPSNNGWNPNGDITKPLYFGSYGRIEEFAPPSLECSSRDAFTLPNNSQGNGKLAYPVGLITVDEMRLAGGKKSNDGNTSFYLYTGSAWWAISPAHYNGTDSYGYDIDSNGNINSPYSGGNIGVRPAVSLKAGTKFVYGGDGTPTNPYVIE